MEIKTNFNPGTEVNKSCCKHFRLQTSVGVRMVKGRAFLCTPVFHQQELFVWIRLAFSGFPQIFMAGLMLGTFFLNHSKNHIAKLELKLGYHLLCLTSFHEISTLDIVTWKQQRQNLICITPPPHSCWSVMWLKCNLCYCEIRPFYFLNPH